MGVIVNPMNIEMEFFHDNKLSVIPIPYGKKKSAIQWKPYQKRQPTEQELNTWFHNNIKTNIAVVCGEISGNLVVLDCDSDEKFNEIAAIICNTTGCEDIFSFTTIVKTYKGFHIYLKTAEPVKLMRFPKLDVKGEGGYVVAPPSLHPDGTFYTFTSDIKKSQIRKVNKLSDIGLIFNNQGAIDDSNDNNPIFEGERNNTLTSIAGTMRNRGMTQQAIESALLIENQNRCNPPLAEYEVQTIAKSVSLYPIGNSKPVCICLEKEDLVSNHDKNVTENVTESLKKRIEAFGQDIVGTWLSYEDLDKEFNLRSNQEKENRRQIISRLLEEGLIEKNKKIFKQFRFIDKTVRVINFKEFQQRTPLDIKLPLGIEKMVNIYKKNIIVIAGAPDAGKTAWVLNFVRMNQDRYTIHYMTSEMSGEELSERLSKFEDIELDDWTFQVEERTHDFHDGIRPDDINIIDYLEITKDAYEVADHLRLIHDKLRNGIAIVLLQKKVNQDMGRGAEYSLEKPRLYLSMDNGKAKIVKAKNWVDKERNPNRLIINYKIVGGCKYLINQDWHEER